MAKSKRQRIQEARQLLAVAREQWDDAVTDSWDPPEPADCVGKAFYAFENAVMAAVLATGGAPTKRHPEKAQLAHGLGRDHGLSDVSDRLSELNELRKNVSYGEPGTDLQEVDLEDLMSELGSYLDEVERLIGAQDKGS